MRRLAAAGLLIALAGPAMADGPGGTYKRGGANPLAVTLFELNDNGQYAGLVEIGTQNCTGRFGATGKLVGERSVVLSDQGGEGKVCRVTVTFAKNLRSVTIKEDDCLDWHGASCAFEGAANKVGP